MGCGCTETPDRCINGHVYYKDGDAWIKYWKKKECVPANKNEETNPQIRTDEAKTTDYYGED